MTTILFLHGALGSASMFAPLKQHLTTANIMTIDFPRHGNCATESKFSIQTFADFLIQYLDEHQPGKVDVFGFSMGGYVAIYAASLRPDLFGKIMTLATKFEWNEEIASNEIRMLNPEIMEQKIPAFVESLKQQHTQEDWKELVLNTSNMLKQLGQHPLLNAETLHAIQVPVQVGVGDKDMMVSIDETLRAFRSFTQGSFYLLPSTKHPFEMINLSLLIPVLKHYFKLD